MRKRILLIITAVIIMLAGTSLMVGAADYFDTKDISKGVIHITCNSGGKVKVIIQKGTEKYTYDVDSAGKTETYPLQMGNGSYKISLFKNTSGTSYKLLASTSLDVKITNPNTVFLTSIQNIDWNVDSKAVAKAIELTKDTDDLQKKASILWDYMVRNNKYDFHKMSTLKGGYLPVIDKTLEEKTGICYDFSSLYAAMLRSQGTPAKLIKGYAPKNAVGYHAWNEVYDAKQDKWLVIDSTYDLQMFSRNPKIQMFKNSADFNKVFEY